jgi:hypothetical protein
MTSFEKTDTPYFYHMHTNLHRETYNNLNALSEMGLSRVTDAMARLIEARRMHAEATAAGRLWIVNTGTQLLPLAPKEPASCPLEDNLTAIRVSITEDAYTYLRPLSQPDEPSDLAAFWWSAHLFYDTLETHRAAEHAMHELWPGTRLYKHMGDLSLQGILR